MVKFNKLILELKKSFPVNLKKMPKISLEKNDKLEYLKKII